MAPRTSPSEVVTAGQEIVPEVRHREKRVSLGLKKQMGDDPWMGVNRATRKALAVRGKITNIADYGICRTRARHRRPWSTCQNGLDEQERRQASLLPGRRSRSHGSWKSTKAPYQRGMTGAKANPWQELPWKQSAATASGPEVDHRLRCILGCCRHRRLVHLSDLS
jgi:hypothetical protein